MRDITFVTCTHMCVDRYIYMCVFIDMGDDLVMWYGEKGYSRDLICVKFIGSIYVRIRYGKFRILVRRRSKFIRGGVG